MTTRQNRPADLLQSWLMRQLNPEAGKWLAGQMDKLAEGASDRDLYLAVSMVPRRIGKDDLRLETDDLAAADRCRTGWYPGNWSVDQAARVALLLSSAGNEPFFAERLEQLFATADVRELIAFYRGLPLYPGPARYVARAAEGVRTNMKAVFEAVAHHNPYPTEQFDDRAWNQLVLKALFIGSSLHPIRGFDGRRNVALARTLIDYVHERWAASREVSPELWRGIGPFADGAAIGDLRRALAGTRLAGARLVERQAAGLALHECHHEAAQALLAAEPDLIKDIEAGRVSWETIYKDTENP